MNKETGSRCAANKCGAYFAQSLIFLPSAVVFGYYLRLEKSAAELSDRRAGLDREETFCRCNKNVGDYSVSPKWKHEIMINGRQKKKIGNVGVKSVSGNDFRHLGAPTQDKEPVTNSPDPPKGMSLDCVRRWECLEWTYTDTWGTCRLHTLKPPRGKTWNFPAAFEQELIWPDGSQAACVAAGVSISFSESYPQL